MARRVTSAPLSPIASMDPEELHRIAVERRESRMGRTPRPSGAASVIPSGSAPAAASQVISVTVPVAGMTCRSCEVRIQRKVGRLPNVQRATASAVQGRVTIESSAPIPPESIERAINAAGYEIGRTPWLERDARVWATAAGGILLIIVAAVIAQATGIAGLASGVGDLSSGGFVVALLLGLAAGVSTCMVLVGGLVLALSAAFEASRAGAASGHDDLFTRMRPAMAFMTGRIIGYGVLGAMLGALGASVAMPAQVTAVLMITVAIVMTILGTRLTGLSPRVATWSPTLPMGLGRRLGLGDGTVGAYSDTRAAGLGALSFFLPCGFTQAVQIYALSTGNPLFAGAIMAVFAIGTAPGLLALAGLPLVLPTGARPTLLRFVGVVVIGFAFLNGGAGLRLAGVNLPGISASVVEAAPLPVTGTQPAAAAAAAAASGAAQQLRTYQEVDGYRPGNVSIYAGVPTTWTIESATARSCAAFLVVPDLGIQMRLHEGDNLIELPALEPGTLYYTCSMGMYGGAITIVDRPTGSAGARG